MRLYKFDADLHHTEIDVNSIEGIMLINRLFDNTDLNPQGRFVVVRPKNNRNNWFLLSLADESFEDVLDSGALKYQIRSTRTRTMFVAFVRWSKTSFMMRNLNHGSIRCYQIIM